MARSNRRRLDEAGRQTLWRMWHEGRTLHAIARALDIRTPSVSLFLQRRGGIEPAIRTRSPTVPDLAEREEISRGLRAGLSLRRIGCELGRSPSTISREVARHGGRNAYRAAGADRRAWHSAKRPKCCRVVTEERLRAIVTAKLTEHWSPEQIAHWLKLKHPDEPSLQVSYEMIYKSLFIQSRGALNKQLREHLRTGRRFRQSRHKARKGYGPITDPISIRERPAEVEVRAVPGHWEGDLIAGSDNLSHIATLVERQTRFVMLVRVRSKQTGEVTGALLREMKRLPEQLKKTLTWDRGAELAAHKEFRMASDIDVFFCDPHSPWQRGSNENTNGLLRQYYPKGTELGGYTQRQLDVVAAKLNGRPRKTLGFRTPAQALRKVLDDAGVAPTG